MAVREKNIRLNILKLIIAVWGIAILTALWYIQVVKGEAYERLATGNRIRLVRIPVPRGIIYDRSGEVLADNRPGFDVMVNLPEVEDRKKLVDTLAGILDLAPEQLTARLETFRERPFEPVCVASDVGIARAVNLEERSPELKGVGVQVNPIRHYPYGERMAHLLGYVGQINARELKKLEAEGYRAQDDIGKIGVEAAFDRQLKGKAGGEQLQVDARGYRDKVLSRKDPEAGGDLHLTIDIRAQLLLDDLMEDEIGAAVALDPRNGDILALVSKPGFDPNLMVRPVEEKYLRKLFSDPRSPLVNRAISGEYPPGSPFKLVVAVAGLSSGVINPETTFECNGVFLLGEGSFRCWRPSGHGPVALQEAIKRSCNIYFYQTSLLLGLEQLMKTARDLGLGDVTGLGLVGEKQGFLPGREWKKKTLGEPWYPGDTVNLSIGQGYVLVTPLQLAGLGEVIANEGTLYQPRLIFRVTSPPGGVIEEFPPQAVRKPEIPKWVWREIKSGMFRAVNEPGGTGVEAARPGISICGKTGTVQTGGAPDSGTHAWFLSFAPGDNPRVVLALILEGGISGGEAAAPLAGEFFSQYFRENEAIK